jgi:biotin operon repressor
MLMKRWGILRGKEDNLVKDLKESTLSFEKLGKKYGVSRQAIYSFSKRQGIKRPKRPRGHQTEGCLLCQKLIQISKKPHSEFISIHTILKETGASRRKYFHHLRILRDRGLVSQRFGKFRSKRLEEAYAIYFTKRLRIHTIGRKVGLKNFHAIIRQHRGLGYDVPPTLYISDGRKRSRDRSESQWRKQG